MEEGGSASDPSLWFGFGAPAWSGPADQAAPAKAQVMPANSNGTNLLGMLNWVLTATDPEPRQPKSQCKASHMYFQHDVVGDPKTCIRAAIRSATSLWQHSHPRNDRGHAEQIDPIELPGST